MQTHLLVEGHQSLLVWSKAALNIHVLVCEERMFLNQLGKYLRTQLLDPKVKLCISFVRKYKPSSRVAVPFCMPTSVKLTLFKPNPIFF